MANRILSLDVGFGFTKSAVMEEGIIVQKNKEMDSIVELNAIEDTSDLRVINDSIYDYDGLSVSLWLDVFNKSSIQSFNYFTNGDISSHNLLIPAYEDKEGCF